jgi:hypothetical protein
LAANLKERDQFGNIRTDFKGRDLEVLAWIIVTDQWCAPLDEVIYFQVPQNAGIS